MGARRPRVTVYPHVCGGIQTRRGRDTLKYGLSPRVWGHLPGPEQAEKAVRSIPTCVGASLSRLGPEKREGVYPHVCGGIVAIRVHRSRTAGLSPRVWGHPRPVLACATEAGSIPTCVGASGQRHRAARCREVYPHVCGGICGPGAVGGPAQGLSPRVWGHRAFSQRLSFRIRSIPTCVGASQIGKSRRPLLQVYPHVCGGIVAGRLVVEPLEGLSPRVWGHPNPRTS